MRLLDHLSRIQSEREAAGLQRVLRTAHTPCAAEQSFTTGQGRTQTFLNFCSNDYLGLANHPKVVHALADGAMRYGAGSGASHLVCGHSAAHALLEDRFAQLYHPYIAHGKALLFGSGFAANTALLTTLGDAQAHIFSDKLNHASIIDAGLLARAQVQRFPHGQTEQLERLLAQSDSPIKLIVTDSIFSMDGDMADLPTLLALAEAHDAWLIVDDAHGFGAIGAQGLGALAHFQLSSQRLIAMGTLSKSAGVSGAFVVAHPLVIDALVQRARSYIYTTAMPPAIAHALQASLDLITGQEGQERRARLNANIAQWKAFLPQLLALDAAQSWESVASNTAIQPLIVRTNAQALALAEALETQGMLVSAIRPPTVPADTARLRFTFSAAHTPEQVRQLCDALYACAQ